MIELRLKYAQIYLEDAKFLYENKRHNSAISRLYYASYQAMWAAIGEPDEGKVWKHLAIIKPFVHGFWFNPKHMKNMIELVDDTIKTILSKRGLLK
ncbi:MAG: hypothetical protein HY807_09540 [Nitrospirae bacterium]|nr:hypothetical protein [Nitrospirota bacterium]